MALVDKLIQALRDSAAATYVNQAGAWISPRYRELRARYYKLERRERMLLQLAAAALVVFLAYNLICQPIVSLQAALTEQIAVRQRDLTEVRRMAATYRQVKTELATLEKNITLPAADYSLTAALSTALNGVVDNDKIGGITPLPNKPVSEQFIQYGASLKLNGVNLAQLVDALYRIKSIKEPVVVSNLHIIKRPSDPHTFDVDMTCSVLGKNA
jgi:hypothetical protein